MTIDEMLIEARYEFYLTGTRRRVWSDDESAYRQNAEDGRRSSRARCPAVVIHQERRPVTRAIGAWCDWINSYREALDQDERRRRLETWRQAERQNAGLRA